VQLARISHAHIDPVETASVASLTYSTDGAEGIVRKKRGKGFSY
jgi:hypothetical protein